MKFLRSKFKVLLTASLLLFAGITQAQAAIRVHLYDARYFTAADLAKLNESILLIETILNGPEFREKVLNFTYLGKKQFVQNNGLTNEQVYDYLMTGAEKYPVQTEADGEVDMEVEMYTPKWYQSQNVLGYTNQSTRKVWINRNFFRSAESFEIAGNFIHEWTHKMGFDHDYKKTARRPYSVPYGVGYIIRDLGKQLK